MNEQQVADEYARSYNAGDTERVGFLETLLRQAQEAGLPQWANLIQARVALINGQVEEAIERSNALVEAPETGRTIVLWARLNRGIAYGRKGQSDAEIADYTAIIEAPDAPAELKAAARVNRGITFREKGQIDAAISDYTAVIDSPEVSAEQKAKARLNRGIAYGEMGQADTEIADYTAVIDAPDAPAEQKARARFNRGITFRQRGQIDAAIADYTAVIDSPDAPAEQKAKARLNRGITFSKKGQIDAAITDYTAVIDSPDLSAEHKARACLTRGIAYGKKGQIDAAIADYTAVIDAPDVSAKHKAEAHYCRGVVYDQKGHAEAAIADYTAIIDSPDAPAEQKAMARVNRGVVYGKRGQADAAITDFTVVIDSPDAPAEQKAKARVNRGVVYGQKRQSDAEIADYTAVIDAPDAPVEEKAKARFNRGVTYQQNGERDKAVSDFDAVITSHEAPAHLILLASLSLGAKVTETTASPILPVWELGALIDAETSEKFKQEIESAQKQKGEFFGETCFDAHQSFLLPLREWNSYTPAIPRDGEPARGGGYFIKHQGVGIVIDPGFDFLEIFAEAGGRLCDIDHIIVSHAHNDHTADIESIMMLLHEFNRDRGSGDASTKRQRKVNLYLSQGVARKLAGFLPLRDCDYIDTVTTLNKGRPEDPQVLQVSKNIRLTVLPAYHDDIITHDYAIGLGLEFLFDDGNPARRLLFTGDTAMYPLEKPGASEHIHAKYPEPYGAPAGADLVVAHIGTISTKELDFQGVMAGTSMASESKQTPYYSKHLGLLGTFRLLYDLRPKAALISEFGEEMKWIWIKAVQAIDQKLGEILAQTSDSPRVFAADPGVIYDIRSGGFVCHADCAFRPAANLVMNAAFRPDDQSANKVAHPYLFPQGMSCDVAEIESRIQDFHKARKERTLPHFAQKG